MTFAVGFVGESWEGVAGVGGRGRKRLLHVLRGIDGRYWFNLLRRLGLLQSAHCIIAAFEAVLLNAG